MTAKVPKHEHCLRQPICRPKRAEWSPRLLANDSFVPQVPERIEDTGLPASMLEALICKQVAAVGATSGHQVSRHLGLSLGVLQPVFDCAAHPASAGACRLGSAERLHLSADRTRPGLHPYAATGLLLRRARARCRWRTMSSLARPSRFAARCPSGAIWNGRLRKVSVPSGMLDALGPAINSGAGLFLYGSPGNGKSTLARCMTSCFGQNIWIPHCIVEDGQIIRLFDPAYHDSVNAQAGSDKTADSARPALGAHSPADSHRRR